MLITAIGKPKTQSKNALMSSPKGQSTPYKSYCTFFILKMYHARPNKHTVRLQKWCNLATSVEQLKMCAKCLTVGSSFLLFQTSQITIIMDPTE